jgi:hypothetical protein
MNSYTRSENEFLDIEHAFWYIILHDKKDG